jgi:hypothetical protein
VTSFKLTLLSVFSGKSTETIAVFWYTQFFTSGIYSGLREQMRRMKPSYAAKMPGSGVSGETKLVAQTILATSVAFVDTLSAFLSTFYGELTNDKNKTSGTEARSLICSIVRRMFEDIALPRCLARFVAFKGWVRHQVATEYLWASLQVHHVMAKYTKYEVDTILRSRRLQTTTCTVIECCGRRSTISRRKSVKPSTSHRSQARGRSIDNSRPGRRSRKRRGLGRRLVWLKTPE